MWKTKSPPKNQKTLKCLFIYNWNKRKIWNITGSFPTNKIFHVQYPSILHPAKHMAWPFAAVLLSGVFDICVQTEKRRNKFFVCVQSWHHLDDHQSLVTIRMIIRSLLNFCVENNNKTTMVLYNNSSDNQTFCKPTISHEPTSDPFLFVKLTAIVLTLLGHTWCLCCLTEYFVSRVAHAH